MCALGVWSIFWGTWVLHGERASSCVCQKDGGRLFRESDSMYLYS